MQMIQPPVLLFQAACLRRLEAENDDAAHRLEEVVKRGEFVLEQIQQALHEIAVSQLASQSLEYEASVNSWKRCSAPCEGLIDFYT